MSLRDMWLLHKILVGSRININMYRCWTSLQITKIVVTYTTKSVVNHGNILCMSWFVGCYSYCNIRYFIFTNIFKIDNKTRLFHLLYFPLAVIRTINIYPNNFTMDPCSSSVSLTTLTFFFFLLLLLNFLFFV